MLNVPLKSDFCCKVNLTYRSIILYVCLPSGLDLTMMLTTQKLDNTLNGCLHLLAYDKIKLLVTLYVLLGY